MKVHYSTQHDHAGELEDLEDIMGGVDDEWLSAMQELMGKGHSKEEAVEILKAGNMEGLASHLAKKLGGDPGFFTRCTECEDLADYDSEQRDAICAKAHEMVTGKWPTEGGEKKEIRRLKFHVNKGR